MAKRAVNVRIESDTIEKFDRWCVGVGVSRTAAIERFMANPGRHVVVEATVSGFTDAEGNPVERRRDQAKSSPVKRAAVVAARAVEPRFKS